MVKRATLNMFGKYKLALQFYKSFNESLPENEWASLNFDQVCMARQTSFKILKKIDLWLA
jgi:hypothetical protein